MLVKFNKQTTMDAEGVKLMPGPNQVDDAQWSKAANHPIIKAMMDAGEIEIVEGSHAGKELAALVALKPAAAKQMIQDTVSLPLLQAWLASDQRPEIKKALTDQITEIQTPGQLRNRGQNQPLPNVDSRFGEMLTYES